MNSNDKRKSVLLDHELIAEQYGDEYGFYIEDLNVYDEFEKRLKPGSTVLDLGTGPGRTYEYFHKKGYEYIGYDFSSKMKDKAYRLHGEFPYIVDDIVNVRNHFDKCSVDNIFYVYTIFHLPREDAKKSLEDVHYILKDDGYAILSYMMGEGEEFVDEPYLGDKGKNVLYINYFTKPEFDKLLEETNFEVLYEYSKRADATNEINKNGNDAVFLIVKKKE